MSKQVIDLAKSLAAAISLAFAVFFFMDNRHAHIEDVSHTDVELRERILMSESTRYAEIAKFYSDKQLDGEVLTDAERARLELVQKQQVRISETLKE